MRFDRPRKRYGDRHDARENIGDQLAGVGVGNVQERDARALGKHRHGDVLRRADAGRCVGDLARGRACERDQVAD